MSEDVTHEQLRQVLKIYGNRYGNEAPKPDRWLEIVKEVKYGGKPDDSKPTTR